MLIGAASQRSNQLRNNEFFKIHIKHIPTGQKVSFEGFVTQFSDTYTAQWNEEQVYGRMDPLATYQGTKRNITLGFDIPADSKTMATWNMEQIQKLIQFMYPAYDSADLSTQNVLTAAPLLTLKWTNLISSVNNEGQELVGYINGPISYAPEVAEGGFIHGEVIGYGPVTYDSEGQAEKQKPIKAIRNYFPKKISMNFNFTVLHTHLLGWAPADVPPEVRAALAQSAGRQTSYIFGGGTNKTGEHVTADRFPNVYTAPPPPAVPRESQGVGPNGEIVEGGALDTAATEADNTLREAEALSPEDQARSDEFLRRLQNEDGDRQVDSSEVLDPDGSGMNTFDHNHSGGNTDQENWEAHTADGRVT